MQVLTPKQTLYDVVVIGSGASGGMAAWNLTRQGAKVLLLDAGERFKREDIGPYYDKVDRLIGVCGGDDDSDSLPGSRFHMTPPRMRCGEHLLRKAAHRLGIITVPGRRAVLTRPHRGSPPCHYCGACGRGCDTASFFCSADHLIPYALETGNLTVLANAVVARIYPDEKGLARTIQYYDRHTREECQAGASHYANQLQSFGSSFKKDVKRRYPAWVEMHPYGEVLPRSDNYVTVEGTPIDAYGVPLPKIVYSISDNERNRTISPKSLGKGI